MLTICVTITVRFVCSVSIYCDNNNIDNNGEVYM